LKTFIIIPAEIQGHQFHQIEGDGDLVLHGIQQGPEILAVYPLGVDGESGQMKFLMGNLLFLFVVSMPKPLPQGITPVNPATTAGIPQIG
jgi:hypothetical protein